MMLDLLSASSNLFLNVKSFRLFQIHALNTSGYRLVRDIRLLMLYFILLICLCYNMLQATSYTIIYVNSLGNFTNIKNCKICSFAKCNIFILILVDLFLRNPYAFRYLPVIFET